MDGVFLPAGLAWQRALQRDATLGLHGPDNFHPAPLGTADPGLRLRPQTFQPIPGIVRWAGNDFAGIEFESALYLPVVEHLQRQFAPRGGVRQEDPLL